MKSTLFNRNPYRVFSWTLAGLLLLLLLLEGWRHAEKPVATNRTRQTARILDDIANRFKSDQDELLDNSRDLANTLQNQIIQHQPRQALYESLQKYSSFWGASLYQGTVPIVWNDFSLEPFQDIDFSGGINPYIKVQKINNVLLWIAHIGFTIQSKDGPIPYHLLTARRIRQTNALPIGGDREYNFINETSNDKSIAIDIGIYGEIPPDTTTYRVLHSFAGDSVGVVYAKNFDFQQAITNWNESNRFWRAIYALICFVVIGVLLFIWLDNLSAWQSLFFQLLITGVGWIVFNQIHIAEFWLPPLLDGFRSQQIASYQMLCDFTVDGLFLLITALTVRDKLGRLEFQLHSTSYFSAFFAAIATGALNLFLIVVVFNSCYRLVYSTSVQLLTLQVFPGFGTILFYLCLGIIILGLTIMLLAINQFTFFVCESHLKLILVISAGTFIVGLFIAQVFISSLLILNWAFIISAVYFALVFALAYFHYRYPFSLPISSPLRKAAIYSLIISLAGSTVIYQAKTDHIDTELSQITSSYSQRKDPRAQKLTNDILERLHQEFQTLTEEDLNNRLSFIQARFTQTIESTIPDQGKVYSFDLQFIDNRENLLADYSTNLNSPNWVQVFDMKRLKAVMSIQQITNNTVRPIVQQPELEDAEVYQTFYRGWIPVYGAKSYNPIAWILCSVYKERPNFDKPIRAVLASLNYEDWENSYLIQQYKNDELTSVTYQGVEAHYPVYNILQPSETAGLQNDSTYYYTNRENSNSYRSLLVKESDNRVIKSSTVLPGYQNILFSFFRLNFTLLVTGFIILLVLQSISTGRFTLFKNDERFQYRILDSFLLATLIFLVLLVFTTHYAIKQENKDLIEQQLFDKLEPITKAAEKNLSFGTQSNKTLAITLDSLAAPLNADASFYWGRLLAESTTPQIYQQHLLPNALPYSVYSDLFINQKRNALTKVRLNGQELMIGFRSVLTSGNEPKAAIAIPTFVQSPKFNKQLLQTTSYLIILYLFVFGLFIIGTTIISRQLTRPIYYIQQGLNKISKGNLDTTIPVTSNDEIGSLAIAYNKMVNRLKELQEELAAAEREEAWKEMAQQVAHEIKNPLTPMKLNIQHLERQLASGEYTVKELKKKVRNISQNLIVQIESLSNIASDFSSFSKPIEEDFKPTPINQLVRSVVDLYDHDDKVNIKTDCSALSDTVYGAKDELRRVVINLVKNAHEAMPENGLIFLKTYVRGDSIFIEVEDDGAGISEEDKPKIFVPNFSTKSSGTGLGLAICKKVVQAHEGSISFASIKGRGTTFVIKLPLYHE